MDDNLLFLWEDRESVCGTVRHRDVMGDVMFAEQRWRLQVPLLQRLRYQSMSILGILRGPCNRD
jgi:hypothetical protein